MITSDTRSVLVNAIYFKGKWKFPFVSDQNTKENFHLDENSVVKVDYMNLKKKFQYGEIPDLKARTIELEYAVNIFLFFLYFNYFSLPFNEYNTNIII